MSIYPVRPAVVDADPATIHRFLGSPTQVAARVRELANQRFISDFLLRGRIRANAGAILFEQADSLFDEGDIAGIAPGAEYPRGTEERVAWLTAEVTKYGKEKPLTDERIGREGVGALNRVLRRGVNTVVRKVDTISLAVIGASVTQDVDAIAAWDTDTARILRDVALAVAAVEGNDEGYEVDTIVLDDELNAYLTSDNLIISGLAREGNATLTQTGRLASLHGKAIAVTNKLPNGRRAGVFDTEALGALGYEVIPSPEWDGDPANGVESRARRNPDGNDEWLIGARRPVVPIVQEPGAGCWITGA